MSRRRRLTSGVCLDPTPGTPQTVQIVGCGVDAEVDGVRWRTTRAFGPVHRAPDEHGAERAVPPARGSERIPPQAGQERRDVGVPLHSRHRCRRGRPDERVGCAAPRCRRHRVERSHNVDRSNLPRCSSGGGRLRRQETTRRRESVIRPVTPGRATRQPDRARFTGSAQFDRSADRSGGSGRAIASRLWQVTRSMEDEE